MTVAHHLEASVTTRAEARLAARPTCLSARWTLGEYHAPTMPIVVTANNARACVKAGGRSDLGQRAVIGGGVHVASGAARVGRGSRVCPRGATGVV